MLDFMMKKFVYIYTYGCQMNVHDSEKMLGTLENSGYAVTEHPEQADLIIFNTCAIREKAEQKFYSQLGRSKFLKNKRPGVKIAVAGCIAQDAQRRVFKRAPYVDFVIGPQNIHMLSDIVCGDTSLHTEENPDISYRQYEMRRESKTRAWVSIMYGCNNFCSYCIVPFTRGRELSRPSSSIISEIRQLRQKGYVEVTLLGQNVNSYNSDMDFVQLLREISRIGMDRVRFITSHPRDLSPALIDAIAELTGLCEHLHLPLQSGSDIILQKMNRRYSYSGYLEKVLMVREKVPGIAITTDLIIGFPGETQKDYDQTVNAVREIEFDGIFGFNYSRRNGTLAYDMDEQIPDSVKSERLNNVLKIQDDISLKKNRALEGTNQEILIEGPSASNKHLLMGRTRTNKIVTIEDSGETEGTLLSAYIEKARHHSLKGTKR
jgi:tRNA-2-methylthio-N6-dimethylallyladenosine synthase